MKSKVYKCAIDDLTIDEDRVNRALICGKEPLYCSDRCRTTAKGRRRTAKKKASE